MGSFLRAISRLKIIIEDAITKIAPIKVFPDGTSPQIKYPNTIAKTKAKIVRKETTVITGWEKKYHKHIPKCKNIFHAKNK